MNDRCGIVSRTAGESIAVEEQAPTELLPFDRATCRTKAVPGRHPRHHNTSAEFSDIAHQFAVSFVRRKGVNQMLFEDEREAGVVGYSNATPIAWPAAGTFRTGKS